MNIYEIKYALLGKEDCVVVVATKMSNALKIFEDTFNTDAITCKEMKEYSGRVIICQQ